MNYTMYDFRQIVERFEDDFDAESIRGTRFDEEELEFLYDLVREEYQMTISEIHSLANEEDTWWKRGNQSLKLALIRMYILYNGELPLQMKDNPTWYIVPETMRQFLESKGIDVEEQLDRVREKVELDKEREREITKLSEIAYYFNLAEAKDVIEEVLRRLKRNKQNAMILADVDTDVVIDGIKKLKYRFMPQVNDIIRKEGFTDIDEVCESEDISEEIKQYVDKAVYFKIKRKLELAR